MNPLVSVIVPVYNREKYIEQCLSSIIGQTYKELEVIVINDGSTDGSLQKIQNFVDNIVTNEISIPIKVINIPNAGVSNARNIGIHNSLGDYVTFIDSDDYVDKNHVENMVNMVRDSAETVLPIVSFRNIYENGEKVIEHLAVELYADSYAIVKGILEKNIINQDLYPSTCNKLFNRSILTKYEILFKTNINYGEDWLFVIEYLKYVEKVRISSLCTYNYVHYTGVRLSQNYRKDGFKQAIKVRKIIAAWFPDYDGERYFRSLCFIHWSYQYFYAVKFGFKGFSKKIKDLYDDEDFITIPLTMKCTQSISSLKRRKWKKYLFYSIIYNLRPFAKFYVQSGYTIIKTKLANLKL